MNDPVDTHKPLEGKVAQILNSRELAINIGATAGVSVDMKFKVLSGHPMEIRDPETNELLGYEDREKVRVKVSEVKEKHAVCRTYKTYTIKGGLYSSLGAFPNLFASPRTVPQTLRAADSELPAPLSEQESYVKRGDRVVQILEEDDEA